VTRNFAAKKLVTAKHFNGDDMQTPWGPSQHTETIIDGFYAVVTSGHGGYLIRKDVAKKIGITEEMRDDSFLGRPFGDYLAWEEDCAWAVPCLCIAKLPDTDPIKIAYFKSVGGPIGMMIDAARATIAHFYPRLISILGPIATQTMACSNALTDST
jgi:hypothetical protein